MTADDLLPEDGGAGADDAAPRPLTILQVLPKLNAGGVERGALEIAQAIIAAGGRALVVSAGGRMESRFRQAGAEVARMAAATKNPARLWWNSRRLAALIRREGVDLVHARSRAPAWSALWACRRCRVPFVTTYHGAYGEQALGKRFYNSVMARGDMVIAISEFIAELVSDRHAVPRARITVIPRGADLGQFSEEKVSRARLAALAEAWGAADDTRPVLMMPGRLTRWKGQTLFLEAIERLKARRGADAFQAVLVGGDDGDGKFEASLRRFVVDHGLSDCVRLVGHCDDMPAAFRLAAFAVSASLEPEAFGRVAVEAQAMGAPVIAAAHGGACETVLDGATGWWFPPGDVEALTQRLDRALELPLEARKAMGRAAVAHVRGRYTVATMQRATLAVYETLAGRRFPRGGAEG